LSKFNKSSFNPFYPFNYKFAQSELSKKPEPLLISKVEELFKKHYNLSKEFNDEKEFMKI